MQVGQNPNNTKIRLPITNMKDSRADGCIEVYVDAANFVNKHIRDFEVKGVAVANRCVAFTSFQKNDTGFSESLIIELSKEELVKKLEEAGFTFIL